MTKKKTFVRHPRQPLVVVVIVVVAVILIVVVVVVGLNAVLWWTVWVGSVPLDIRRAKAQNRTSPCRKFLSIWSHVCLRCLCEKRGVASVRRSGTSKQILHLCLIFSSAPGGVKTHPLLR